MAKNFQNSVIPPGIIQDGGGNGYLLTVNADGSINVGSVTVSGGSISDGVTAATKATVMLVPVADAGDLSASYGLMSNSVQLVLNAAAALFDRAKSAGFDDVPASGIPGALAFKAMPFQVGTSTAVAAPGAATITLTGATGLKGTNHGVSWHIGAGSELVYDSGGANEEKILVTNVNTATPSITATFANTHAASVIVKGFTYNQDKDAAATADGATGKGTNLAVGYGFNAGGPGGDRNYDRFRNLQGKGVTTATISSGSAQNSTSLVLSGGPAASGPGSLQPGQPILLYTAATGYATGTTSSQWEAAYVGLNYVPGATTVPIICGTLASLGQVNNVTYDRIAWDTYAALGPQTNEFLPFGVGLECPALFNSASNKFAAARCAPGSPGVMAVSSDGNKATFRAGGSTNTLYSGAAAVILEIQGSATKTIRIKKISIYAILCSATFYAELQLGRATSVAGGTPAAQTPQKMDTASGAATAVLNIYTGASVAGSGYAAFSAKVLPCVTGAAGVAVQTATWDFCQNQDQALVLRGTSQWVEVYNTTLTLTSAKFGYDVEWEEDNS